MFGLGLCFGTFPFLLGNRALPFFSVYLLPGSPALFNGLGSLVYSDCSILFNWVLDMGPAIAIIGNDHNLAAAKSLSVVSTCGPRSG